MKGIMTEEISTVQKLINTAIEFVVNYSFQVVGAIIILIIGMAFANWISRLLMQFFQKKNLDITLAKFITAIIRISIIGFAVLIALGKFGITIAPHTEPSDALKTECKKTPLRRCKCRSNGRCPSTLYTRLSTEHLDLSNQNIPVAHKKSFLYCSITFLPKNKHSRFCSPSDLPDRIH